jgi:fumarate reductase flavoprotein subunit
MEALHAKVLDSERVHFLACAAARRLTTDAKGTVTGAIFELKEGDWQVRARRGVVLTTGGFSQNTELIEKFAPRMSTALKLGGSGNTGDGLLMAWKLGADLVDMAYVNGTFGISINNYPDLQTRGADEAILRLAIYRGGIAVNLEAQRFADESISYKKLGEICLDQMDGVGFQIWDANIMAQSVPAPTATDLEGALARGLVRRADSIHELARTVGLTPERLISTVTRYNADVDAGRDSVFGRTSLGRG